MPSCSSATIFSTVPLEEAFGANALEEHHQLTLFPPTIFFTLLLAELWCERYRRLLARKFYPDRSHGCNPACSCEVFVWAQHSPVMEL